MPKAPGLKRLAYQYYEGLNLREARELIVLVNRGYARLV